MSAQPQQRKPRARRASVVWQCGEVNRRFAFNVESRHWKSFDALAKKRDLSSAGLARLVIERIAERPDVLLFVLPDTPKG